MSENIQGYFFVEFYVEADGDLSEFNVTGPLGPQFDKESLRILRESPAWTPALKDGKKVRQPMSFMINIAY